MCRSCPPDPVAHVEEVLRRERFMMITVPGARCSPELAYTVGLTRYLLPELVVSAVRPEQSRTLLSVWADYLLDRSQVLAGEHLTTGPWHCEAVTVDAPGEVLLMAGQLYGQDLRALQLAWADAAGRWPWEPGHRARRAGQAVFGTPSPRFCDEHRPDRLDVPDGP